MLQCIAICTPPFIAVLLYHHLLRRPLTPWFFIASYGMFTALITVCLYMIYHYLFNLDELIFSTPFFIRYTLLALVFAFIMPLFVTMIQSSISINITRAPHDKKSR